ncbi:bifunctional phosphopantothenoylcysteine decarboxylase/phosphopantothenate--cysteine ligase CoaBC [Sanguibacter sp. HDW7]|uniref:bifunctional phosphopantothenoylcysteine decarboxylase/phosphopantothenate--cysteine ligase CoaBC n=1 Tax=Sanguibacter sp. HDW7 TaxID=2714931 RepID=UPI00140DB74F|nr:bifunctional phosphopantothenoylcysteine decarboxylase/phosphopantothenate--cysteine ligase CoaBC [Sanguibacter sp. HDW7]QIK83559.1 bifunctional phosphopantothenoylcysteine decarboxylase/phosphopantothenate--cysteine ligase CoaBC [Sanguibacter sp. HDW7]
MRIILGVGGGIAAYKSALLLRLLTEAGHSVRVMPTAASLEFVGRATWEALSGEKATHEVFDDVDEVAHVRLGHEADLVVVAPATADLLARAASGRADDLLTTTLLTVTCPVLLAPAMHTEMWRHPATQANVELLRSRGVTVLEPDSGRLTGADSGPGRLPEPATIADAALGLVRTRDLAGLEVVVSAGGTVEALDPVRFLGNSSSGRQGVELARAALERGANVRLVTASIQVATPPGVAVTPVRSAREMQAVMVDAAATADVVVMAAAVADFRPETVATDKIKKVEGGEPPVLRLVENPDILAGLARDRRDGQTVVGFAAETGDADGSVLDHARSKARRKGADLLVANDVAGGRTFGAPDNAVTILDRDGGTVATASGSKAEVAHAVWDAVLHVRG